MPRYRRKRRHKRLIRWIAGLSMVALAILLLDIRVRPLLTEYALNAANWSAMRAINSGVEEVLGTGNEDYTSLVRLNVGEDGNVKSVETDVTAINRLKAHITDTVMTHLEQCRSRTVRVPLGSALGGSFWAGRGPFLPLKVETSAAVVATLTSRFESAGVNQTKHSLWLCLNTQMYVAIPGQRQSASLENEFLLAETVVVGTVPSYLRNYEW